MITLQLSGEERDELVRLIENALSDTKIELRRTRKPDWRDELQQQEDVLASLLGRLKEKVTA